MSDQTTNDPQAPYGEQPKREPLLSDEDIDGWIEEDGSTMCSLGMTDKEVRDFYEAKITSGELMVVKTCKFVTNNYDANIDCDGCGWSICYIHVEDNPMKFCPGCGAKIIEP